MSSTRSLSRTSCPRKSSWFARSIWLKALQSGALLIIVCAACADAEPEEGVRCGTSLECRESEKFAYTLGRCVAEVYCLSNQCAGHCIGSCQVVDPLFDPCEDAEQICSESANTVSQGLCTALPIECSDADDCPLFRPNNTDGWQCVEGVCRFPGFAYAIEPLQ